VRIGYPDAENEREILKLARTEAEHDGRRESPPPMLNEATIFDARRDVLQVYMTDSLQEYIVQLVLATRDPSPYGGAFGQWVQFGASPRATIALDRCARAHAWLASRDFVTPEDIQQMAYDVIRHRVLLTFEAEAEGVTTDDFITDLIGEVPVP